MTALTIFIVWAALSTLVLLFLAGAKKASYTPEEIEAEYNRQYIELARNVAR